MMFYSSSCALLCGIFLFFKQKTAYEMRISDWSSDVCSSDLMPGELWPVVERDGASEAAWQRLEHGGKMACCAVRLSVLGPLDEGEAGGAFMGDEDALAILGKEHEVGFPMRSEEHTSELQSLMRTSYAVFCLKKKKS